MEDNFEDDEDYVDEDEEQKNWKGIIIAIVCIVTLLSLIITSVIILTPPDEGPRVKGRRFELEDIFNPLHHPLQNNGTWGSGNDWIFMDPSGGVSLMSIQRDNISFRSLISNYTLRRYDAKLSGVSSDLQFALIVHDVKPIHRHSRTAKYSLYQMETGDTRPLSTVSNTTEGTEVKHSIFQLVKWSPVGNSLVMVSAGDIYFKPDPKNRSTIRLTNSALPGVLYNGITDWLYEEEILESNSALWFSNDGHSLLYLTFNDSNVGTHTILQYGACSDPYIYPEVKQLRFPKPGTPNPIVTANVVELRESRAYRQQQIQPPEGISDQEYYITAAGWVKSTEVGIVWTSRSYNLSIISICSSLNGSCEEAYRTVVADKRGWMSRTPFPFFTSNPSSRDFITIAPIRDGDNGFFDHLVYVDVANLRSHSVTHGTLDVTEISAWDEDRKLIYFLATPYDSPKERRFYRLRLEYPYTEHNPECLSCVTDGNDAPQEDNNKTLPPATSTSETVKTTRVSPKMKASSSTSQSFPVTGTGPTLGSGTGDENIISETTLGRDAHGQSLLGPNKSCSFVKRVEFSSTKAYFTLECDGPDVPFVTLCSASPMNLRHVMTLQSNDALRELSGEMAFPLEKLFDFNLTSGHTAQVRLLLPPGLREDEITKYPLVLHVHGGPGTQLLQHRWNVDFSTYLASQKDFVVAQVDGRGSGGKGLNFQHQVYQKVGVLEAEDHIEILNHVGEEYPFVEKLRVGVYGWGYGGFVAAMIMGNKLSNQIFHCGSSIAPITNWKLYNSAYAERYMGTPKVTDNYKGYAESDVTLHVDNFYNKTFYLIHGTADERVHVQHSLLLAKALVGKKIPFRQQIYTDEDHDMKGVQMHLHKSLEDFFVECFDRIFVPEFDPDAEPEAECGGEEEEEEPEE
ncbi:unnamed protein product [Allacma fusca]|uniref:Venom dipeptidyl peptidase 4 n=1 Tax=Allacma fusca TaxID=39272 RepID=A0A8J2PCX9_9HEXA|nr:unnamed protein product [Allacma fusca]